MSDLIQNQSKDEIPITSQITSPSHSSPSHTFKHPHCILSLDLGIKNIGYSISSYTKIGKLVYSDITLTFGILNITEKLPKSSNVVTGRCTVLHEFFNDISDQYIIDYVIIERQVSRNVMAMELMYATTAIAMFHCSDIIIFDPKNKFNKLNIDYDTTSKKHKKQSTTYAHNLIKNNFNDLLTEFNSYTKKDDISDAINQSFVWLVENGILAVSKDDFKVTIMSS